MISLTARRCPFRSTSTAANGMSAGLFKRMTKDEILDLLAYLISSGNSEHEYFKN